MKILLEISSTHHFTEEQNTYSFLNLIELEWDFNLLPSKGDLFDLESIVPEEMIPDFAWGLSYHIEYINWLKIDGVIIPKLTLDGE